MRALRGLRAKPLNRSRAAGLAATASEAIIGIDARRRIVFANTAAEGLFGYGAGRLTGRSLDLLLPPVHRESHAAQIAAFRRGGVSRRTMGQFGEVIGRRADGSQFHAEASISQRGRGRGWTGSVILRDVSERVAADRALRDSHRILERIFETTHFCIAYLDRAFNFIRVNRAYAAATARPAEYFPGRNLFDLFPSTETEAIFRQAVETGNPFTAFGEPFRFPEHPEWGVTYWDWTLHPLVAEDGVVEALLIVLVDVTERERAARAARSAGEWLRVALAAGNIGLWERDLRTDVVMYSDEWKRQIGYEPREIDTRREVWIARLHPEDRERVLAEVAGYVRGVRPEYRTDYRLRHKDGSYRWIHAHGVLLRGADGDPERLLGCHVDITDLKEGAEKLRGYASRLKHLSRQLREVEERERRSIAREVHDRIGQNLSTLNLMLSMLAQQPPASDPKTLRESLTEMQQVLRATMRHARDVLGELRPLVLEDLGLRAALNDLASEYRRRTRIPVEVVGAPAVPRLPFVTEIALYRIAREALANAAKHARAARITIGLEPLGTGVLLSIADDGTGFDPAPPGEREPTWGLTTMRERAEAVDIDFRLESAPGRGTRIELRAGASET